MKKPVLLAGLIALALLVCGCPTAVSPRFYTLNPTAKATGAYFPHTVSVGPVLIPAVVDRPQIVTTVGPNEIRIDEFNRWAAPLQDEIGRVVTENLAAMLESSRIIPFPRAASEAAHFRVTIQLLRFDSLPERAAVIDARWAVRDTDSGRTVTGRTTRTEDLRQNGHEHLAAAHSRALERLSGDIAQTLLSFDSLEP